MDCAAVLASVSGMPEPQVANALLKFNGETISLLCKALNLSDSAFARLAEMRCHRLHLPTSQGEHLAQLYTQIDPAIAQRTLRFVKVRNSISAA